MRLTLLNDSWNIFYKRVEKFSRNLFDLKLQSTQEKNRISSEMNELRDHLDIKDRKISVLQRKVRASSLIYDGGMKIIFPIFRSRIWKIFWRRRIIKWTLPSPGSNRWNCRQDLQQNWGHRHQKLLINPSWLLAKLSPDIRYFLFTLPLTLIQSEGPNPPWPDW